MPEGSPWTAAPIYSGHKHVVRRVPGVPLASAASLVTGTGGTVEP